MFQKLRLKERKQNAQKYGNLFRVLYSFFSRCQHLLINKAVFEIVGFLSGQFHVRRFGMQSKNHKNTVTTLLTTSITKAECEQNETIWARLGAIWVLIRESGPIQASAMGNMQ